MQGSELDSMILVSHFQRSIFCDYGIFHVWDCSRVLLPAPSFATLLRPHGTRCPAVVGTAYAGGTLMSLRGLPHKEALLMLVPSAIISWYWTKNNTKEEITIFDKVFFHYFKTTSSDLNSPLNKEHCTKK